MKHTPRWFFCILSILILASFSAHAQDKSVRPGINDDYKNPDVDQWEKVFENEDREIFAKRMEIVAACKIKPGSGVADIGAGTGLFTRLFAKEVGADGKVYAVDIAKNFIEHIEKTCKEQDIKNVTCILCTADSSKLPANSIDLAFICDVYHHFEFPFKTMASIHEALRPGGRVFVVDFKLIQGQTPLWRFTHVRAGQEQVTKEITSCGFKLVESPEILKDNYCMIFEKVDKPEK